MSFTPIEGRVSFSGPQLERNFDVDVGFRTAFVVVLVFTAPPVDHTDAVAVVTAQVNQIALGQVQLKSVVGPRTKPGRIQSLEQSVNSVRRT